MQFSLYDEKLAVDLDLATCKLQQSKRMQIQTSPCNARIGHNNESDSISSEFTRPTSIFSLARTAHETPTYRSGVDGMQLAVYIPTINFFLIHVANNNTGPKR